MATTDYISESEFQRWTDSEQGHRDRLDRRLGVITDACARIEIHLAMLNGRTGSNTSGIAALETRLIRIEEEADTTMATVQAIRAGGCQRYVDHAQVLRELNVAEWSPQKKAAVGGGMLAGGALIWPALQEIAKGVQALLGWIGAR